MLPRLEEHERYLDDHWPTLWDEAQRWGQSPRTDWRRDPVGEVFAPLRRTDRCPRDWVCDLRDVLKGQNLTALARRTGLSVRHLQRLRKGSRTSKGVTRATTPSCHTYLKIMCALGRGVPLVRKAGEEYEPEPLENWKPGLPDRARCWKTSRNLKRRGRPRQAFFRNSSTYRYLSHGRRKTASTAQLSTKVAPQPNAVAPQVAHCKDEAAPQVAPQPNGVVPQVAHCNDEVAPGAAQRTQEGASPCTSRIRKQKPPRKRAPRRAARPRSNAAPCATVHTRKRAKKEYSSPPVSSLKPRILSYDSAVEASGGDMSQAAKELKSGIRGSTDFDTSDRMMKEFGNLQLQQSRENRQLLTEVVEKLSTDNQQVVERLFEKLSADNQQSAQIHSKLTQEISEHIESRIGQLAQHLAKPQAHTGLERLIDVLVEIGSAIAFSMDAKPVEVDK